MIKYALRRRSAATTHEPEVLYDSGNELLCGTSENAVKTQIWTVLIAMPLLKFLQLKSSWNWSLSNLAAQALKTSGR